MEMNAVRAKWVKQGIVFAVGALAVVATPVAAQKQSDGWKFLEAVRKREGTEATALLDQPGSTIVNARDIGTGETALHAVVQRRDLTWVRFLLQRGANPNIADRSGVTPLQIAARLGFVDGVSQLIDGGADINVADQTGETPLIGAVHRRDVAMIELLIGKGASPDRTDNSGRTARDYALLQGESSSVMEAIRKAEKDKGEQAQVYGPS